MYASQRGHTDCAKALLQARASVHLKTKVRIFVMICIHALALHTDMVSLHVQSGRTALWVACDKDHSQTAQVLIEFGADVNLPFDVSYA